MSAKKTSTPRSRLFSLPSRSRTPVNLNSTVSSFGPGTSRPLRAQTSLDVTTSSTSSVCPTIKKRMPKKEPFQEDLELECDLVYNGYLQALMKQEIVTNAIKKHEQDISDQLAIQKDKLYKSKLMMKKTNEEINALEKFTTVYELINTLEMNCNRFKEISNLNNVLEEFASFLESFCNKVHVKNIDSITDQEGIEKLIKIIEECTISLEKIESSGRNKDLVKEVARLIKEFQRLKKSVAEKQRALNDIQKRETFKLLKGVSEMYAKREKYDESD